LIGGIGEEICNGGFATGPHVHFALFYNGAPYDLQGLKLSGWTIHEGPRDPSINPYSSGYIERDGVIQTPWTWLHNDYHLYYGTATNTSLHFYGNPSSAVDRLKIPIDDPNRDNPGPMLDLGMYDFVLEWWMKTDPGANTASDITCGSNSNWKNGNFIFDRSSSFGGEQWGVSLVAGKVAFGVTDGSNNSYTICSTSSIDDGAWHHIAIQRNRYPNSEGLYDDGQLWLFVDGVMEASEVGPIGRISYDDGTPPGTTCGASGSETCIDDSYLVIGGGKNDQGLPYAGWIDDIRASAWLRYFDDFTPPTAPHDADSLTVALLALNSGTGNVAYDIGGFDGGTSNGWLYSGGSPAGPEWSPENPFDPVTPTPTASPTTETPEPTTETPEPTTETPEPTTETPEPTTETPEPTTETPEPTTVTPEPTTETPSPTPSPTAIFDDVQPDHWAFDYINALYNAGYVAGCSSDPLLYCPETILNRAQSAVFVLRGQYGAIPDPPYPDPATPTFTDVDPDYWGYGWIESLWTDGFTAGCSTDPPLYCPLSQHTRAEGSVFFLRVKNGVAYSPPPPTGIFTDVDTGAWYAGWVEAAYNEGILPECNTDPLQFCPTDQLDRAWAAYMMVQAKGGLPLP
jgi:hypothetical protein